MADVTKLVTSGPFVLDKSALDGPDRLAPTDERRDVVWVHSGGLPQQMKAAHHRDIWYAEFVEDRPVLEPLPNSAAYLRQVP